MRKWPIVSINRKNEHINDPLSFETANQFTCSRNSRILKRRNKGERRLTLTKEPFGATNTPTTNKGKQWPLEHIKAKADKMSQESTWPFWDEHFATSLRLLTKLRRYSIMSITITISTMMIVIKTTMNMTGATIMIVVIALIDYGNYN